MPQEIQILNYAELQKESVEQSKEYARYGKTQTAREIFETEWINQTDTLTTHLINMVNLSSSLELMPQGMLKAIHKSHRTLQAEFVELITKFLEEYGNTPSDHIDARNAYAVQMVKRMSQHKFPD